MRYAPGSPDTQTALATVLWALDNRDAAFAAFTEAARLAPGATYARENLCRAARALARPVSAACPAAPPRP